MSIVVGVDGSEGSKTALRWALAEARLRQTSVEAVYAWSFPSASAYAWAPAFDQETLDSFRAMAKQVLDETVSEVAGEPAGVEIKRTAIEGAPGSVLVEKGKGAELLVVGSRGLGGFRELVLGSIGHQCAHHAPCPVVIVPQPRGALGLDGLRDRTNTIDG